MLIRISLGIIPVSSNIYFSLFLIYFINWRLICTYVCIMYVLCTFNFKVSTNTIQITIILYFKKITKGEL